jgi:hypothetical protein
LIERIFLQNTYPIKNRQDLAASVISWMDSGQPEGALKEHIKSRADALRLSSELPPEFRDGSDKAVFAGRLRK